MVHGPVGPEMEPQFWNQPEAPSPEAQHRAGLILYILYFTLHRPRLWAVRHWLAMQTWRDGHCGVGTIS